MARYGLIGKNIAYSFSRRYFKTKFEKEQLVGASYVNFDSQTLEEVKEYLCNDDINGYNVTIPYKEEIIPLLDQLDTDAHHIGAVNTVKRNNLGQLIGYNTDYIGFKQSLLEYTEGVFLDTSIAKKALILGTGGASKAVVYALTQLGVHCQYVSRNRYDNTMLYSDISKTILSKHSIVVNCTPLGTSPNTDAFPDIPYEYLNESHILYDLIYNPVKTQFLTKGEKQGATIISGLRMLELQAEAAWEIWQES
ncbi:shikimate dehydrogenase [uncultured Dokdonia sp.]|uniref:shikimate dehydrogenase family protein n=1 Tax=uncultured Dokdonia sp. TaxID=575653 RepID=UPI00262B9A78|nr:shikimate dehydrogenase [uncultured Dokdonia sp.]